MKKLWIIRILVLSIILIYSTSVYGETSQKIIGCGEQCIKILCNFYEISYCETDIVRLLNPNDRGESSFADLATCLSYYNLDCFPFRGNVQDLEKSEYPMILHLNLEEWQHYIVVMKSTRTNQLMGYDPIAGREPRQIDLEKFARRWTGVGLIVFPKREGVHVNIVTFSTIPLFMFLGLRIGRYLRK